MVIMENDQETRVSGPPYISYSTFVTLLDWLRTMPVIPTQLDRSLWQDKFNGSNGVQLMSGLRFLRLLDGQRTMPRLGELAKADKERRETLIRETLREAYGHDLVDELPAMTPQVLDNGLRALGTTESTHRKATSFLVNAAKVNGITVPTSISKKARIRQAGGKRQSKPVYGRNDTKSIPNDTRGETPEHKGTGEARPVLHSAIMALLKDLELVGPKWTTAQRDTWLKTFEVNLDYAYPPQADES